MKPIIIPLLAMLCGCSREKTYLVNYSYQEFRDYGRKGEGTVYVKAAEPIDSFALVNSAMDQIRTNFIPNNGGPTNAQICIRWFTEITQ